MKKLICLCLLALLLGALCITASAEGTERAILASSEKVQQGKTIAISVTLADCSEISGYTVELVYDTTVFQLEGATWQPSDTPFGTDTNTGTLTLDAPAVPDNSPILSFNLRANEDAPLDTSFEITCNINLHTEAGDIPVMVQPVNITISCPHDFQKNLTSEYLKTPATCTEPAEYYKSCSRCGAIDENQTFISGMALSHNFKDREMIEYLAEAGDCQKRDIYYVSCVACGLKGEQTFEGRTLGAHIFDNDCDSKCNVCFTEREAAHKTGEEWLSDTKGHWHACALCDEKVNYSRHTPGPGPTPDEPQTCMDCGFVLKVYEEHVHDYGQAWFADEDTHWQECDCGEATEPEAHSWDTTDPAKHICPTCGASKLFAQVPTTPEPTPTTPSTAPTTAPQTSQSPTTVTRAEKIDTGILWIALILGILLILSLAGNIVMLMLLTKKTPAKTETTEE